MSIPMLTGVAALCALKALWVVKDIACWCCCRHVTLWDQEAESASRPQEQRRSFLLLFFLSPLIICQGKYLAAGLP